MTHVAVKARAQDVCRARGVAFNAESIYLAIGRDLVLAAALARLLLWTDPKPLPAANDEQGAWELYLRVWRTWCIQPSAGGTARQVQAKPCGRSEGSASMTWPMRLGLLVIVAASYWSTY